MQLNNWSRQIIGGDAPIIKNRRRPQIDGGGAARLAQGFRCAWRRNIDPNFCSRVWTSDLSLGSAAQPL